MRKNLHIIVILLSLFLVALSSTADNKKIGQEIELKPKTDEPDKLPVILASQPTISAINPIIIPEASLVFEHRASNIKGIDVSHYQGRIDWKALKNTGLVSYAYVKSTESIKLVDDTYAYNIREAHKAGIPVGCYHFFSPTTNATEQLNNFISAVDLSEHDLVPMVDVELRGKSPLPQFIQRLKTFIQGIEQHYKVKPILYTSVNFYNSYLAGHFDDYIYMIARYAEEIPTPEKGCKFAMWQYSATGRITGIRGAVDCSCFVDSYELSDIMIKK